MRAIRPGRGCLLLLFFCGQGDFGVCWLSWEACSTACWVGMSVDSSRAGAVHTHKPTHTGHRVGLAVIRMGWGRGVRGVGGRHSPVAQPPLVLPRAYILQYTASVSVSVSDFFSLSVCMPLSFSHAYTRKHAQTHSCTHARTHLSRHTLMHTRVCSHTLSISISIH